MKKLLGLAALALSGCISHIDSPQSLLLRNQSDRFEDGDNHVAVEYLGAWGNDTADDDFIILKSYNRSEGYNEIYRLIGSGDSACVLGIGLRFEIINDNDGKPYNNILKVYQEGC